MKHLLTYLIFATLSTPLFAHPGGHKLICQSALNSGSDQRIKLSLSRANSKGWSSPEIKVTVDNIFFELTTPDEMDTYGTTFHNSPLKVITSNVEVPFDTGITSGHFSVTAVPETVKAFDINDEPVEWSLESENDECNDSNGRATFQGVIHGYLYKNESPTEIKAQIMDCELKYNSGMAC